jgi:ribosomal protein L13
MARKHKIHYAFADCGTKVRVVTSSRRQVTCERCRKALKRRWSKRGRPGWTRSGYRK